MQRPVNSDRLLELLEHQGWVRDLARRLVRDPALADDVAQSVWVSALEHGPSVPVKEDSGLLRSWLGTVTRNAARQLRRSESRRADHEARAASRSEGRLPSAAELVERSALNRRVAEAVERLGEPYSSTLLLRFFEGLPPREIARRQGVPVETVRTRLTRGIATLRSSLDEEFGDRGTWMAALAPLAGLRLVPSAPQTFPSEVSGPAESLAAPSLPLAGEVAGPVSTAAIGAALMNTKLLLSIVGASAVGIGAWTLRTDTAVAVGLTLFAR